jgi:hypothetical protein
MRKPKLCFQLIACAAICPCGLDCGKDFAAICCGIRDLTSLFAV